MFKRASAAYGTTPEPETPYQKAGQVWDQRLGAARVQAANWPFMALGCLALAMASSVGLVWRSLQSTVTPYVVEVDELGAVQAVGPAIARYEPTDAQIAHHLARFLENTRGLSVDPVVVRQNWLDAYDFTTDRGAMALNDYARDNDPFENVGRRSRTVDVVSVLRVSDDTFQARWIEKTYENAALTRTERFTALMTLLVDPPSDAASLRANALGIFIHGLNWGQDLDTGDTP
ncbi:MAG: conjugal transfer protein TrbF [Pseudomonadota bacterium]